MKLFLIIISFVQSALCLAQSETELDRRGGFKDIHLGSSVENVEGAVFKKDVHEKDLPVLQLYRVEHPDYHAIGSVVVDRLELLVYRGLIYEISVIAEKDPNLMKGLESALGPAEYNLREKTYSWSGKDLSLRFSSYSKNLLELRYHSVVVSDLMKKEKTEKIENIAEDF